MERRDVRHQPFLKANKIKCEYEFGELRLGFLFIMVNNLKAAMYYGWWKNATL